MTTIKAIRLASLVTAINVLVASGHRGAPVRGRGPTPAHSNRGVVAISHVRGGAPTPWLFCIAHPRTSDVLRVDPGTLAGVMHCSMPNRPHDQTAPLPPVSTFSRYIRLQVLWTPKTKRG